MAYNPIKVEYVNPFIESMTAVFHTMLNLNLRRGPLYLKDAFQPSCEVTGVIGLSGVAKGSVLLGLSRSAAMEVTGILLNQKCESVDHDVVDAVGELTNMIAGAAKSKLEELHLNLGLPSVVVGKNHSVVFPTGVRPVGIPFESDVGVVCLEVSFVDT